MKKVISKKTAANINMDSRSKRRRKKVDRISHLPEPIIQQILSHLNSKESARTGFLSKSLFNATRPVLDYDIACLNQNFMELVLKSLKLYHKERLPLQKFRLNINAIEDEEACRPVFDTAQNYLFSVIKLALSKGIVELDLDLRINYFGLPFQHKDLEWCNLKKLKLQYLPIDDHTLSYLISSCPLLTYLHLETCKGLKKIVSLRFPNLREFHLIYPRHHPMEEVDISAPKLEYFKSKYVKVVHIDEGTSLKSLSLTRIGPIMKPDGFQRLLSSCPFLEDLRVNYCWIKEKVVSSRHSIKFLRWKGRYTHNTIVIDAPNLQQLEYKSRNNGAMTLQPIDERHLESLTLKYSYIIEEADIEEFLQLCRPKYFRCKYTDLKDNHMIMRKLFVVLSRINKCARENLNYGGYGGPLDCRCWRHDIKEARIYHVVGNEHKPLTKYNLVTLSTVAEPEKVKISFALEWKHAPKLI